MSTDALIGFVLLILLLAFASWQSRVDQKKHSKPKTSDYLWVLVFGSLWFAVFMAVFSLSPFAYIVTMSVIFLLIHVINVGEGKRGQWRQIKDGCFLAWIISIPVCFTLWMT